MQFYAIDDNITWLTPKKERYRISELQSSANHNFKTQAALQPTHSNMELPSINFLLLDSHDEHHDILSMVNRTESPDLLRPVTSIEESLPSSQPESSQISNHGATIRWTQWYNEGKEPKRKCRIVCFSFPDMVTQQVEWSQKGVLPTGYLW